MKPAVHTVESILKRTEPEGDCLLWRGQIGRNGTPLIYSKLHGGTRAVRKVLKHLSGDKITGTYFGTSCGNPLCVEPTHIVQRSARAQMKHMAKVANTAEKKLVRLAAATAGRRAKSTLMSREKADQIKADDRPCAEVAADHGICTSYVSKIRLGHSWGQANPFSGLL